MGVLRPTAERVGGSQPSVVEYAPDYWDSFAIPAVPGVPAREWARLSLRGAGGPFGSIVWHRLLGFALTDRQTPGTLVGWRVSRDTEDEFVMDTDGTRMNGRMVFAIADGQLVWTTMLRFHGVAGERIWSAAGHAHRAIAPRALDRARRSLT